MGLINGTESDLPMVGDGQQLYDGNTNEDVYVGAIGSSATLTEVNRVADASARIVSTSATALTLTITEHAERVILVNSNSTVANTLTLPVATGSGAKITVVSNIAQTPGSVVVADNRTDVINGTAFSCSSTEEAAGCFLTSATSDKISLNAGTTGGLGGDKIELWDVAANTWNVSALINASGTLATPFSAT